MIRALRMMLAGVLALTAAVQVGCAGGGGGGGRQHDTIIALDPALASNPPAMAVHVVGVGEAEQGVWAGMSMGDYWQPASARRREVAGMVKEFTFGPGKVEPQTLSGDDPAWKTWAGGRPAYLIVLANLPGAHADRPGDEDRRLVIPLAPERWDSGQKIMVTVQRSGLRLDTPPKEMRK
jgi:hypothetical protein